MKKVSLSIVTFIALTELMSTAYSFEFNQCWLGGNKAWRPGYTDYYFIAQDSMNSTEENDVEDIINDWNEVKESNLFIDYYFQDDNDGLIELGDGRSEIGIVTNRSFYADTDDNVLGKGVTQGTYENFVCEITEADAYFPDDATGSSEQFQFIFSHELGHTTGLGHDEDYGLMSATLGSADGHNGDNPFKPLPDEREGLAQEYSNNQNSNDLSTDQFLVARDETLSDDPEGQVYLAKYTFDNYFEVCPRDTISPVVTNLNFGNSIRTAKNRFSLKKENGIGPEVKIATYNTTVAAFADYTRNLDMKIPSRGLSYNTLYKLYGNIDYNNSLIEQDESNNKTNLGLVKTKTIAECVGTPHMTTVTTFGTLLERMRKYKTKKFKKMVQKSDFIFDGELLKITYKKVGGAIYSEHEFRVNKVFRGEVKKHTVTITQLGGHIETVDEYGAPKGEFTSTSNQVNLTEGENYLLFTGPYASSQFVGGDIYVYQEVKSGLETYYLTAHEDEKMIIDQGELNYKEEPSNCERCKDVTLRGENRVREKVNFRPGKARVKRDFIRYVENEIEETPFDIKNVSKLKIPNNRINLRISK